jgi:hypothetical protein
MPEPTPDPVPDAPAAPERPARVAEPRRSGALARLISLVITVGLAWALAVAVTAWLLGLFLARG